MNQGPEQGACVLLEWLLDVNFLKILEERDLELAEQVRAGACQECGGPLHVANYPRKERGPSAAGLQLSGRRLSFCCGHCRKRHTSPSVRFCGRRVYVWVVFLLAGVLPAVAAAITKPVAPSEAPMTLPSTTLPSTSAPSTAASATIASAFGVPGRTLTRWRKWWREDFPASRVGRELQALLIPPVMPASLPGGLLERLAGTLGQRVLRLLGLLLPLSFPRPSS